DVLSHNLREMAMGSSKVHDFEYRDKGSMATIGRNKAVVDLPKHKMHFKGLIAWLIWMGLHLFLILGVKNRIMVFINWVYNYFTYDQSLRLIFKEFYRPRLPIDDSKQKQINAGQTQTQPQAQPQTAA
ncbi:MAG: hypothetical protein M3342_06405, partial [Bacteroidota bacterium]|nr:hypothetical protein [Bacteroidota bacterium]